MIHLFPIIPETFVLETYFKKTLIFIGGSRVWMGLYVLN